MTPEQTNELFRTLGRIEANTETNATALAAHTVLDTANFERLDSRLRSLEKIRWKVAGAAGLAVLVAQAAQAAWSAMR